jgi:ubiquinone/menaquinone biosynthesis C-methylase UbiE
VLSGEVIVVGAGHGINFPLYPESVTRLLAVEPEEHLLELAREAPVSIDVVPGIAEELPADNASFDAAVVSLVLCTARDQDRAIAELRRVLRPRASCVSTNTSSPTTALAPVFSASPTRRSGRPWPGAVT